MKIFQGCQSAVYGILFKIHKIQIEIYPNVEVSLNIIAIF